MIDEKQVETSIPHDELIARAKDAHSTFLLQQEQSQREREEATRVRSAEALKHQMKRYLDVDCEPEGPRVEVAGLTFAANNYGLSLIRPCSKCGQDAYSVIHSLSELGGALETDPVCQDWEAHRPPRSAEPKTVTETTSLEALGEALINFLDSEGYRRPDYE